jgi:XTP/dITP diphosphohydrolase
VGESIVRTNDRRDGEFRAVKITTHFTAAAAGSVLYECGRTRVIVTASVEESVPPFLRGTGRGWLTAEYAMLPGSTATRKQRDGLKKDGRSVEIQRLIGRSLRACLDLNRLGERTITIDCDVIEADGGTRTASITGGFVALCLAVDALFSAGTIADSPIMRQAAAISVGIVDERPMLDLAYEEDARAQVDMNVVMTREAEGETAFAEIQGTGEGRTFSAGELSEMLALAGEGAEALFQAQREALGRAADVIGRKPRLVIASKNFGKIKEMRALLGGRFDVISMTEAGFDEEIEETGETFEQNALIKAEAISKALHVAAIADDSGLEVDALSGGPGVYSARYAGVHGDDAANNQKLLEEMRDVSENRAARYVAAVALSRPGLPPLVARGTCEGEILREYRGGGGFGYDPLFYSAELQKTFAEAEPDEKNRVSHRARALQKLTGML